MALLMVPGRNPLAEMDSFLHNVRRALLRLAWDFSVFDPRRQDPYHIDKFYDFFKRSNVKSALIVGDVEGNRNGNKRIQYRQFPKHPSQQWVGKSISFFYLRSRLTEAKLEISELNEDVKEWCTVVLLTPKPPTAVLGSAGEWVI